ncbi:SDR family NAD(P)-dependent oxidoreductase, partial [Singulisphaera rosea]
ALAEVLVREGARVVLTGRSHERLEQVANGLLSAGASADQVITVAADLTVPEDRHRLVETARQRLGAIDLAINSAGVGATGHFETHDPDVLRKVFEINVFALAEVTREVLPLLRLGEQPALVNLGSIVARRSLPGRPEYSASKHAVAGFTDSIRAEWAKFGIHVHLLNPGFTDTEFERNLVVDTAVYPVSNRRIMTPDKVAEAALRAVLRGKNELTLTLGGKLLLLVNRISPRFVDWGFGRWTLHLFPNAPVLNRARSGHESQATPIESGVDASGHSSPHA